jgi:hypothetical protein
MLHETSPNRIITDVLPFLGEHFFISNSSLPAPLLPNDASVSKFDETFSLPPTDPLTKRYSTAGHLRDDKMEVVRHNHVSTDHPMPPVEPCASQGIMHYFPSDIGNTVLATHRNEVHFDIRCRPDISEDEVLPPREKSAIDLLVVHDDISKFDMKCCEKNNKSAT